MAVLPFEAVGLCFAAVELFFWSGGGIKVANLDRVRHTLNSFACEFPTPPRSYGGELTQLCGCGPSALSPLVCKGSGHGLEGSEV